MFNFFKKQPVKEVIVDTPEDIIPPQVEEVIVESPEDIIPSQVKSDMEYIKRIYDQLGIMWDNGDKRAKKAGDDYRVYARYRRYEDDFINLQVDTYDGETSISIYGKMEFRDTDENGVTTITNREFTICSEYVSSYCSYSNQWKYHPINWKVSDECKANVLKHIEENILNTTQYESLQAQFCRKLSNKEVNTYGD